MNKKTKVLFLVEAFDKGGIEKVTLDIVNHLAPEKYDITVQTFWYGGYCQSLVAPHVKVIPFFFRRYVRGIIRLIQYLPPKALHSLFVRKKYDIEIACSDGGAAKVISGSSNPNSRKICWVHMDVVERGSQLKEFRNAKSAESIYSKFDCIVHVSEACKLKFEKKFGVNYPLYVVRNPMPAQEIQKKANAFAPVLSDKSLNFVCVGRLVEEKGVDRILEVLPQIKSSISSDFHISIIGEGILREKMEQKISESGLQNEVTLLGFCENPYPYVKNADAFLLSSRDEACPLVVGESLIVGTPVLATDCCGVREWLHDGTYGMVLENSYEGIYAGLSAVLAHPKLLLQYRSRIPEAQKEISFEKGLAEFESILR